MPVRIQRKRTAGWRMPATAIYVGRPTKWGNLWTPGSPGIFQFPMDAPPWTATEVHASGDGMTQADAVNAFRALLTGDPIPPECLPVELTARGRVQLARDLADRRDRILSGLPTLRGHDLACWCAPDAPCHADVLLEIANGE